MKKLGSIEEINTERITKNGNTNELLDKQIKMLRDLYLENLKNGLKHKEAINNALLIVTNFKVY